MAHGDNELARLRRACDGNLEAAALLQRIIFWHKKGNGRMLDGKKYVVNSREKWAEETASTFKPIKVALEQLRKAHLIETQVRKLDQSGYPAVLHTRPTQRAIAISEGSEKAEWKAQEGPPPGPNWDLPPVPVGTAPQAQEGPHQGEIQGDNKETDIFEPDSSNGSIDPETGKDSGMGTMDEQLKLAKEKTNAMIHKPNTPSSLEKIWKTRLAEITGLTIGLKKADQEKLKTFIKRVPEGQADAILTVVLGNWVGFVQKAQSLAGAWPICAQPQVWFLIKHSDIAAMMAKPAQVIATPKPKTVNTPKAQSVQSLQSIAQDDDDPEISYEETVALLKGTKNG